MKFLCQKWLTKSLEFGFDIKETVQRHLKLLERHFIRKSRVFYERWILKLPWSTHTWLIIVRYLIFLMFFKLIYQINIPYIIYINIQNKYTYWPTQSKGPLWNLHIYLPIGIFVIKLHHNQWTFLSESVTVVVCCSCNSNVLIYEKNMNITFPISSKIKLNNTY